MIARSINSHDRGGTQGNEAIRDSLGRACSLLGKILGVKGQRSSCKPRGQQNDGDAGERAPMGMTGCDRSPEHSQYDRSQ